MKYQGNKARVYQYIKNHSAVNLDNIIERVKLQSAETFNLCIELQEEGAITRGLGRSGIGEGMSKAFRETVYSAKGKKDELPDKK